MLNAPASGPENLVTIEAGESHLSAYVPESIAAAVGQIVVQFTLLEEYVGVAVWSLMAGLDTVAGVSAGEHVAGARLAQRVGQTVTIPLTFARKVDLLEALVGVRGTVSAEAQQTCEILVKALRKAGEGRNTIVHSLWAADPFGVPGTAIRVKPGVTADRPPTVSLAVISQEVLSQLVGKLAELTHAVSRLPREFVGLAAR